MQVKSVFLGLHHNGLPTANAERAKEFWCRDLGFAALPEKSNWLGWDGTSYPIHLMPPDDVHPTKSLSKHVAIEVSRLEAIVELLLKAGHSPFQAALSGERKSIDSADQRLDFGIGTVFVYDPDGNVIEFVERGRGIFCLIK